MWLALIFFCASNDVMSCQLSVNTEQLYLTEPECIVNAIGASLRISSESQPIYISPSCIKIGNAA